MIKLGTAVQVALHLTDIEKGLKIGSQAVKGVLGASTTPEAVEAGASEIILESSTTKAGNSSEASREIVESMKG